MKYYITFQQMGQNGRPIDHSSTADFDAENAALIPNVGDYVHIDPLGDANAPRYSGRVKSRLFTYLGSNCGVNIVVEDIGDDDIWGELIKE
jgi:hypothetical protein